MPRCNTYLDIDYHDEWAKESMKPSLNARKGGFITELRRPVFDPKPINRMGNPSLEKFKNKRTGTGNYDIKRLSFQAVPITGRNVIDFEKLQLQEQAQQGIRVQLGDKTIRDLFQIQVGDPSDREWLRIYNERKANGLSDEYQKVSPPLGRPQRTIIKLVNPGQQMFNFNENLKLLLAQANAGAVENVNDLATITAKLTALMTNINDMSNLSREQADVLRTVLVRVNLPINFRVFFYNTLQTRIISRRQYDANAGQINLYLLNKAENKQYPVIGIRGDAMKLNSMITALGQGQYLDLAPDDESGVIPQMLTREDAVYKVAYYGVDDGFLNGSPITDADIETLSPQRQERVSRVRRRPIVEPVEDFIE